MPVHHVHRYNVVRTKVAVEAPDHAAAIRAADAYLAQCSPIHPRSSGMDGAQYPCPKWLGFEDAEEVTGYLVDEEGDEEHSRSQFYDANSQPAFSVWEDQDDFPAEDWRLEVAAHETRLGYEEWVSAKRAERFAEAQPEVITGNGQFRAGKGAVFSDWLETREAAIAEYFTLFAAMSGSPDASTTAESIAA